MYECDFRVLTCFPVQENPIIMENGAQGPAALGRAKGGMPRGRVFQETAVFLHTKMPINRKMLTEMDILELVCEGKLDFPPLTIVWLAREPALEGDWRVDASVELLWGDRRYLFAVECKARSTPKVFRQTLETMRQLQAALADWRAMLVAPFLSTEQLTELERNELSGLDLSGNGVVVIPGQLLVFRTGSPRKYREPATVRNVFRGSSSIVTRGFLLQPSYRSVNAIRDFIVNRGGQVAISTVSKALKRLEEELVVGRSEESIRVLQPDRILELLAENYRPPRVKRRFFGKTWRSREDILKMLEYQGRIARGRVALTGLGSVGQYAVMAREERISLYLARLSDRIVEQVREMAEEGDRFWNLELLETDDKVVFFDLREERGCPWASPIQAYLELSRGDKRDKEAAEQIRQRILSDLDLLGRV